MRLGISSYTFVWGAGVPGYPLLPQSMTVKRLLEKAAEGHRRQFDATATD